MNSFGAHAFIMRFSERPVFFMFQSYDRLGAFCILKCDYKITKYMTNNYKTGHKSTSRVMVDVKHFSVCMKKCCFFLYLFQISSMQLWNVHNEMKNVLILETRVKTLFSAPAIVKRNKKKFLIMKNLTIRNFLLVDWFRVEVKKILVQNIHIINDMCKKTSKENKQQLIHFIVYICFCMYR